MEPFNLPNEQKPTHHERAELERREEAADGDVAAIAEYGAGLPGAYAGCYTDPESGLAYVGFTTELDRHTAALRARVIYPDLLRGFQADRTLVDLHALRDRVDDDAAALKRRNITVLMIEVDVVGNQIVVGTQSELADHQRDYLRVAYGPGVTDEQVTISG